MLNLPDQVETTRLLQKFTERITDSRQYYETQFHKNEKIDSKMLKKAFQELDIDMSKAQAEQVVRYFSGGSAFSVEEFVEGVKAFNV